MIEQQFTQNIKNVKKCYKTILLRFPFSDQIFHVETGIKHEIL